MGGSPETGRCALCVETVVLSLKHTRELGPRLFDHIQLCLICDGQLAVFHGFCLFVRFPDRISKASQKKCFIGFAIF